MSVTVRTIDSVDGLIEVYGLTYREYVAAGYAEPNGERLLAHYAELDGIDETTVFGAYLEGELVGTNTITRDGPMGLHVDQDFPTEVEAIRRWCHSHELNLGASWRLVTSSIVRHNASVMVSLIRATIRKGCESALHITLYSLHPHHVRFYERLLGLKKVAEGLCRACGGNPAVLMLGDSRLVTSRCPRLAQPCLVKGKCSPPRWTKGET
jgi:hypothetical protein